VQSFCFLFIPCILVIVSVCTGLSYGQIFVLSIVFNLIASAIVSLIVLFILNGLGGGSVNILYGMKRTSWDLRDQLAGYLSIIRCHKMNKRFDQALRAVNVMLFKNPDFPEALLLKSQILHEGFGNLGATKGYLKKLMEVEPDKSSAINRWASCLFNEINK